MPTDDPLSFTLRYKREMSLTRNAMIIALTLRVSILAERCWITAKCVSQGFAGKLLESLSRGILEEIDGNFQLMFQRERVVIRQFEECSAR